MNTLQRMFTSVRDGERPGDHERFAFLGALVFGLVLLLGGPISGALVHAQSNGGASAYERSPYSSQQLQSPEGGGGNLPSWAEPETRPRRAPDLGRDMRTKSPGDGGPGDGPGDRVPLGGLEWLLLAGAGYGLFKLREE